MLEPAFSQLKFLRVHHLPATNFHANRALQYYEEFVSVIILVKHHLAFIELFKQQANGNVKNIVPSPWLKKWVVL